MSILNKYKHWGFKLKPNRENYWDLVLSKDTTPSIPSNSSYTKDCLSAYINFGDEECYSSNYYFVHSYNNFNWKDSINTANTYKYFDEQGNVHYTENKEEVPIGIAVEKIILLKNIGRTGIDNGLLYYGGWDKISNKQFLEILTESSLEIPSGNTSLFLYPVTGNTKLHSYKAIKESNYASLKGGFFQGFFKLNEYGYQVLPTFINNEWNIEITLRPQNYEEEENTLNKDYPNNKGIFFYMGTRAENKFCQLYNCDLSEYKTREKNNYSALTDCDYFTENPPTDDYLNPKDYYEKNISLSGISIVTENGVKADDNGYYEIETDNKFLIFNRTKNGYTTAKWEDDIQIVLTGSTNDLHRSNLYLLMNRTKSGYTTDTIEDYYKENKPNFNFIKDITGNAFCLKYNDNGSISYRYLVEDENSGYTILEETTTSGLVNESEWATINAKFVVLGYNDCKPVGTHKMKLYIYINGYLKFVSKEIPEFNFRELDDNYSKQEGVPYNISIGGGTQGLCESIWLDYAKAFEKILPIEENFAGTFIGDIKSFKFYTCPLQYQEIKNNASYEENTL